MAEDSRVGLVEGRGGWLGVREGIGWGVRGMVRGGRDVGVDFSAVGQEFLGRMAGVFRGVGHVGLVAVAAAGGRSLERIVGRARVDREISYVRLGKAQRRSIDCPWSVVSQ